MTGRKGHAGSGRAEITYQISRLADLLGMTTRARIMAVIAVVLAVLVTALVAVIATGSPGGAHRTSGFSAPGYPDQPAWLATPAR